MNPQAIILDVDGTLTSSEKIITPKTLQALLKAQQEGIRLILASGRPVSGLMPLVRQLEMDQHQGLIAAYNGSKVMNVQTGEVLFNQPLPVAEAKAVLEHMKNFAVKPMIDKDDVLYVNDVYDCDIDWQGKPFNIIRYESRGGGFRLCEIKDLAAFADFEMNKILTAASPEYLQENMAAMAEPFKDRLNCVLTAPYFFEFTAKGVDKAKALATVLAKEGIDPEQTIAFGDAANDISMLQLAGRAIAMANAVPEVKAMADEITLSNDEDGIAHSLESLL